ncbi:ribosome assembly cofactor RimP [Aquimarina addita]|uniref:Ribosome maturation factor RimP n=1 Tax=Aquimarina addita TaxID=870485 RepID=A0ABP6UJP7_9FLAO
MSLKEKAHSLLEAALEERESLFLIDYTVFPGNRIEIVIDGDAGVTVEDCIAVSRAVEHNLDREEEDFALEVMSAGVSEGLRHRRQYKKNVGRTLKVHTKDEVIEGKLISVTDKDINLVWKAREPKPIGKGKITVTKEASISYDDIEEAKVMITF